MELRRASTCGVTSKANVRTLSTIPAALRSGCAVKRNQRRSCWPEPEKSPCTASSSNAMIFSPTWASSSTAMAAASRPVSETCRPTAPRSPNTARNAGFASSMTIEGARTMLIIAGAAISTSCRRERFSCVATAHGPLDQGAEQPLLDVREGPGPLRSEMRDAQDLAVVEQRHAIEHARVLHELRGQPARRDPAHEAFAEGHGRAVVAGEPDRRLDDERVAIAQKYAGRVGGVGRAHEDAQQLVEKERQLFRLERCRGDLLERHEPADGLVALAGAEADLRAAHALALLEAIDERLHARPDDADVAGLGDAVGGVPRSPSRDRPSLPSR